MNAHLQVLLIAYVLTAGGMLLGMRLLRADKRGYVRSPLYSVISLILAVVSWNALRAHVLPKEWELTHPVLLYYVALAVYALFGFVLGSLVGRATRASAAAEIVADIPSNDGPQA